MAIPSAVQKQGDLSDELAKQAENPQPVAAVDVNEPAKSKEQNEPQKPTGSDKTKVDTDDYKERFIRFKQKHDIEVPALRQANAALQAKVDELQEQINSLKEQQLANSESNSTADKSMSMRDRMLAAMTEEERENWSEDFIDLMAKMTQVAQESSSNKPDPEIESRLANIEQLQQKTETELYWDAIDSGVPDWQKIQETDEFAAYLQEYDPLLGAVRGDALEETMVTLNAHKAIAIFDAFKKQQVSTTSQRPTNPMEALVTPDGAGGNDGTVEQTRTFTVDFVTKFYNAWAEKSPAKFKEIGVNMKDVELIDKQITEAQAKGLIMA